MQARKYLHSAAYRVGENRFHISDIEGYEGLLKQRGVPLVPTMGIEFFCVTSNIYTLVRESIAQTVVRSGAEPDIVDHVIVCSSNFVDRFTHRNRGIASALVSNDICPKSIRGICGAGCADLLCGIEVASNMLDVGVANNVLLIGMEALCENELSSRIRDYALISDAAVSFIVSNSYGSSINSRPFEILAYDHSTMISRIGAGMTMNDARIYVRGVENMLSSTGFRIQDVEKVFGSNTLRVVKTARGSCAGFSEKQIYLENVERLGHCLVCDSIINLVDYDGSAKPSRYILFAEAEGHSSSVLLNGCVRGRCLSNVTSAPNS